MTGHLKGSLLSAYLQLHFIVWIWGFTAILGKLITIPPVEMVLYRTLIAVFGLYILLHYKKIDLKLNRYELIAILASGILIALHWVLFFLAARMSNISICLAGMATASLWTSFLDPWINKRRLLKYEIFLGLISVLGIVVVFNATFDNYSGFLIAVFAALLSSLFTVVNGIFVRTQNHYKITFYQMIGASLSIVVFLPIYFAYFTNEGLQWKINGMDFLYLLILGLICTVYAYSIAVKLMHRLSAFVINLTVNLEPIYGIIMAFFIFQSEERMEQNFYLGTAIILLSVLIYPVGRLYFKSQMAENANQNR